MDGRASSNGRQKSTYKKLNNGTHLYLNICKLIIKISFNVSMESGNTIT